jgi:alpha 1,3-glucosidase
MILQNSIAGIHFVGQDIPGFFNDPKRIDKSGNEVVDELLVLRWYQIGAFFPFCRAHAHEHTKYREPWTFSEQLLSEIRDTIRLRYELLPYLYTCFYLSRINNDPILRPLWYNYPKDPQTNWIED